MIPYLLILAIIGILGSVFHFYPNQERGTRLFLIISCIILAGFMGLRREDVGIDTAPYSGYFRRIVESTDPDKFMNIVTVAPVYSLLNKALGFISPNPQILLIIVAFITCASILYFIYVFSDNVYLSTFFFVAFYFYINCFNGMRQGLAIALCALAFTLMFKSRKWLTLTVVILAVGVHLTSLVIVPFLFLSKRNLDIESVKRISVGMLCLAVAALILIPLLLELFITVVPRYSQYSDFLYAEQYRTSGRNILRTLFYAVVLIIFYIGVTRRITRGKVEPSQKDLVIMIPAICGVIIALVFFENYLICERIAGFLLIFIIVVIPNVSKYLTDTKTIYSVGCCAVACGLFIILLNGNYGGVVPYTFFWM